MYFLIGLVAYSIATSPAYANLSFVLAENGLTTLAFDGVELLSNRWSGELQLFSATPKLHMPDGRVVSPQDKPRIEFDREAQTITRILFMGSNRMQICHP